jgi:uncharacterized caspase-like protein
MPRFSFPYALPRGLVALLVAALALALALPVAAQAPQPEKRIALVVGDGAYANAPLATAANDAGLIAQTLQAAGFDVVGARDLDGDALRKSFRDFMQKAESAGPGTVAMIYLSGYAMQYVGENYFIPVDSNIGRDTDIPVEGLRLSDYMRQLGTLPLKAGIMVVDAARQQPFVQTQIASGLALVEPAPHLLIAYNAAPGTVAPAEQGNYGAYAQALAEMVRTGGLPLPEVFNRVRLRVSETSKGGQIPWDTEKLDAEFFFFDRAPDAPPPQGSADQAATNRNTPIRDLGAQEAFSATLERDTVQAYEDFLVAYPNDPLAKRVRAIVAARREAMTWRRTYRADTPEAYWSYLRRYPRGPHGEDARRRLAILTAPLEPPPRFAMIDYDIPPPPPDEIVYIDRPVFAFSDPEFDFAPPPPPPVYFLPPPPPDFVVLDPPIVSVGLFILPQPMFVPIPVYVRPPAYVAPPPNNIIYNNIHNTTVINTVINQPAPAPPVAPASGTPPPVSSPTTSAATAALPPSVRQRASLIQQGKLPVPPSIANSPAAKPGATAPVVPANIAPTATPQGPGRGQGQGPGRINELPKPNALPVPGSKGAPPAPAGANLAPPQGAATPNANLKPSGLPPGSSATTPGPGGGPPKPALTQTQPTSTPEDKKPGSPPPPSSTAKPAVGAAKPPAPPPPPPPPPRPQIARPTPPQPPPPVRAAPPPPRPQVSRPAPPPPPPVRAAPPPPPPRAAAPPPPPPRPAPPPPPPPPRVAAPPPPRPPAPPPPKPAAPAKKCPPNVPKC